MFHPFFKVESFEIIRPYTLDVHFDDGSSVKIDFEPVLYGELYGPLRDLELFEQVSIDPEVKTLVWPNGADFDPSTLHDWAQKGPLLQKEAAKWELVAA